MVRKETRVAVRQRARFRCEYCLLPEDAVRLEFQIDHAVAQQHVSDDSLGNIVLSCCRCNWHKGPNLASIDPQTEEKVWLFNPRLDSWERHFSYRGVFVVGLTAVGRATVALLQMNDPGRVAIRSELMAEGRFFE